MRKLAFIVVLLSAAANAQIWDTPCPVGTVVQGKTPNPVNGHLIAWLCISTTTGVLSSPSLTLNTTSIPTGLITMILSGTCPIGWTEATALNGKMLRGTLAANGDVGTAGGAATITPTGTVTQPTLTMNSYIPAGTVAAPTFTGSSVTTSAVSAGTPAGTNSTTTSGSTAISATATAAVAVTTGSGNSMATNAHTHPTHTHTVPAETFTGSAMATHTHTDTAAGTNSAPAFTGSAATLTGTVSQPTFTGSAVDPSPSFTRVIFCSKQ